MDKSSHRRGSSNASIALINLNRPFIDPRSSTAAQTASHYESTCVCQHVDQSTAYGRCPYCSWSARMPNPHLNTQFDPPPSRSQYPNPGLHPPQGWPQEVRWEPPYGTIPRKTQLEGFQRFDPRCVLWYSQWEIVFAKTWMNLDDITICDLFRYRWAYKDPTTRFMQSHHVAEILQLQSDGHPWHAHAFWFQRMDRFNNGAEWRGRGREGLETKLKANAAYGVEQTTMWEAMWARKGHTDSSLEMMKAKVKEAVEKMNADVMQEYEMMPVIEKYKGEFLRDLTEFKRQTEKIQRQQQKVRFAEEEKGAGKDRG